MEEVKGSSPLWSTIRNLFGIKEAKEGSEEESARASAFFFEKIGGYDLDLTSRIILSKSKSFLLVDKSCLIVNYHDLKAVACHSSLDFLIFDVISHDRLIHTSNRFHKIPVLPETVSPEKFLQFWKFLS